MPTALPIDPVQMAIDGMQDRLLQVVGSDKFIALAMVFAALKLAEILLATVEGRRKAEKKKRGKGRSKEEKRADNKKKKDKEEKYFKKMERDLNNPDWNGDDGHDAFYLDDGDAHDVIQEKIDSGDHDEAMQLIEEMGGVKQDFNWN